MCFEYTKNVDVFYKDIGLYVGFGYYKESILLDDTSAVLMLLLESMLY